MGWARPGPLRISGRASLGIKLYDSRSQLCVI